MKGKIEIGDRVKITRVCTQKDFGWNKHMESTIGKEGEVVRISKTPSYAIRIDGDKNKKRLKWYLKGSLERLKQKELTVEEKIKQCEDIIENKGWCATISMHCPECCLESTCKNRDSIIGKDVLVFAKAKLKELEDEKDNKEVDDLIGDVLDKRTKKLEGSMDIKEKVFQALGQASVCWSETPKGIFDSELVGKIGDRLIESLQEDDTPDPFTNKSCPEKDFRKELECIINGYSKENGSDTPDFILANYLVACLENFDKTTQLRDKFHNIVSRRIKW